MTNPESALMREIMLDGSRRGMMLFRNNVGVGIQGKQTQLKNATVLLGGRRIFVPRGVLVENQRYIDFGLIEGSGDIIAITPRVISADMVGATVGIFTSIEAKTRRGRLRKAQATFRDRIIDAGGIAIVARSVGDLDLISG